MQKNTLTRKQIILDTAHMEGGAHVDIDNDKLLNINELRHGLWQVSSLKINGVEVGTPENYHFILIRQFAHELLSSKSLTELMS